MKTSKPKQIENLNKAIYLELALLTEETTKPKSTKYRKIHDLIAFIFMMTDPEMQS